MTMPSGGTPPGALAPGGFAAWQAMTEADAKTMMAGGTKGAFGGAQNAFRASIQIPLAQQVIIANDHEARLSAMQDTIDQMTARGKAVVLSSSGWYYPPPGLVQLTLAGIGSGAGGAAGQWNLIGTGRFGGGGGGGGGYNEIPIVAALFPKTGDVFDPIRVDMYLAGNGGSGSGSPGGGGGNIIFGANLSKPYATFQGGVGGLTSTGAYGGGGDGGFGMIPGGKGGSGARLVEDVNTAATNGSSSFASEKYAGGGGGGGGGGRSNSPQGGIGGNGVGTAGGQVNQPGESPHPAMAVGAGGGGGSGNESTSGGIGGFPGGGGAGGFGGTMGTASAGGKGGEAKLYIFEEMS